MWVKILVLIAAMVLAAAVMGSAEAKDAGHSIRFGPDGQYGGYFSRSSSAGASPGIVVIHEWWGLNQHIKDETDKLAKVGYNALAIDLFGKVATDPKDAMQMINHWLFSPGFKGGGN